MARKLIENARRKADVDLEHCTPIRLADGQDWYFPRPWLELTPVFRENRAVAATRHLTFGADLDVLLEAIAAEDRPVEQLLCVLSLAAFLLARNYDLESDEYQRLLVYRAGDDASEEMVRAIIDAALGGLGGMLGLEALADPKASAVGCASA